MDNIVYIAGIAYILIFVLSGLIGAFYRTIEGDKMKTLNKIRRIK